MCTREGILFKHKGTLPSMTPSSVLIVDSHVHIHPSFNLASFLDSAHNNCQLEAQTRHQTESFTGFLLLTESLGDNWFQQCASWADERKGIRNELGSEWMVHRTQEDCSLLVQANHGAELYLVAGRQIVVKENLEVLALLTATQFPDGVGLKDTVDAVRNDGGVAVVPWGFGKWWGRRGQILSEFLSSQTPTTFFLGDNSGRPGFLPFPPQFQQARLQGISILPGSDPLPFSSEYWRPCSAGFAIQGAVSRQTPAQDLRQFIGDPRTIFYPYHQTENMFRFVRNQIAMQIVKRRRPKSS